MRMSKKALLGKLCSLIRVCTFTFAERGMLRVSHSLNFFKGVILGLTTGLLGGLDYGPCE